VSLSNDSPYFKIKLPTDGLQCPFCKGKRFYKTVTVLPLLVYNKAENKHYWVARAECMKKKCCGIMDFTFDPDKADGGVRCERSPYIGMYLLYSNYPRIKNEH
jgi:hypothetical protein